jgi:hypothetical protein
LVPLTTYTYSRNNCQIHEPEESLRDIPSFFPNPKKQADEIDTSRDEILHQWILHDLKGSNIETSRWNLLDGLSIGPHCDPVRVIALK